MKDLLFELNGISRPEPRIVSEDLPFELNGLNPEYEGRFGKSIYTVESTEMSVPYLKALAEAHDAITTYGKAGEENSPALNDLTYDELFEEPMIPVWVIKENCGEPGDDYIVIYNWEGVMRITGLISDSHGHMSTYKVSDYRIRSRSNVS
mgnify:FL=1